jgi:hypothetical protein
MLLAAAGVLGVLLGSSINLDDTPAPAAQQQPAELSAPTPPAVHPAPVEATPVVTAPAAHAAKPVAKHATTAKTPHRVTRAAGHHRVHKHHGKHRHGKHHKHGKRHHCSQ